ncbi:MAG: hypothetical protein AUJ98_01425 [Bacteroidetes bacterium CG2_30_33_31]|nr:MAG: hypothetical protein AUJ98_01425 [Bacteroidetes bacterium CG2_30_33_31]
MERKPEKVFKIRMYGFNELAREYKPHLSKKSAANYFNRLIKQNPDLELELRKARYKPRMQTLSPLMESVFVEFLGEPF